MSRGRKKPAPIAVEDRSSLPPCVRLGIAMEKLQAVDYARYLQVIDLAETYVAAFASTETRAEFQTRLARLDGQRESN